MPGGFNEKRKLKLTKKKVKTIFSTILWKPVTKSFQLPNFAPFFSCFRLGQCGVTAGWSVTWTCHSVDSRRPVLAGKEPESHTSSTQKPKQSALRCRVDLSFLTTADLRSFWMYTSKFDTSVTSPRNFDDETHRLSDFSKTGFRHQRVPVQPSICC